jgi:hypothetical protein
MIGAIVVIDGDDIDAAMAGERPDFPEIAAYAG